MIGPWVSTSIYDIRTIDFDLHGVLTNTAPTAAYRGAGRPEAIYLIERLFDAAAQKLGLDPAEIRRRNLIAPGADAVHQRDGAGLRQRQFRLRSLSRPGTRRLARLRRRARRNRKARGMLRGRGMASFLEWTGGNVFEERVTVAVKATARSRSMPRPCRWGRASQTSYAQLVVDVFGVPIEKHPHRHGRHRPRPGLRQRRLALAVHRRLGDQPSPRKRRWRTAAIWRPRRWRPPPPTSSMPRACSGSPAPTAASACSSWPAASRTSASTSIPPAR